MSIQIGNYTAEGPYFNHSQLRDASGVYVILGRSGQGERWNLVDVGESGEVRSRVANHDRAACWRGQRHSTLGVAAIYANETSRMRIERDIRGRFNPPCGRR